MLLGQLTGRLVLANIIWEAKISSAKKILFNDQICYISQYTLFLQGLSFLMNFPICDTCYVIQTTISLQHKNTSNSGRPTTGVKVTI